MTTIEAVDTEIFICSEMQSRVDAGMTPRDAAPLVLAKLRNDGLIEAFLDRFGAQCINTIWTQYMVSLGRKEMWQSLSKHPIATSPVPTEAVDNHYAKPVIDQAILASHPTVMETQWKVDGKWIRLGDMVKWQLRTLADTYQQLAANASQKAKFFDALATKLPKDKIVRDVYNDDQLHGLMKDSES